MTNASISGSDKALGAFFAAAIGDALGWPQEDRARNASSQTSVLPRMGGEFETWVRRAGGRFQAHDDVIRAGEYSDDTQMILCVSRSLVSGPKWWQVLADVELPLWLLYERGGGVATKRAAEAWSAGNRPWHADKKHVSAYYNAGGNGVAMRVLPHCIWTSRNDSFAETAKAVMADGVTTHGHPRALVGALAYAFGLWLCLRTSETIGYGQLVDQIIDGVDVWGTLAEQIEWDDWHPSAASFGIDVERIWLATVDEMLELLYLAKRGIAKGVLEVDADTLGELGCFDRARNGSGTVTGAAAIYLASRYAPDPLNGLTSAAYLRGADTDTLASMTGAVLASISGSDWLSGYINALQDSAYIQFLAESLTLRHTTQPAESHRAVRKGDLERFKSRLDDAQPKGALTFPDGRRLTVDDVYDCQTSSAKNRVTVTLCRTEDGQSLYFKRYSRRPTTTQPNNSHPERELHPSAAAEPVEVVRLAIRLETEDLARLKSFYHRVLGLTIQRETSNYVRVGEILILSSGKANVGWEHRRRSLERCTLILKVRSLDIVLSNAAKAGVPVQEGPLVRGEHRVIRFQDPDGNTLEVYENHH